MYYTGDIVWVKGLVKLGMKMVDGTVDTVKMKRIAPGGEKVFEDFRQYLRTIVTKGLRNDLTS